MTLHPPGALVNALLNAVYDCEQSERRGELDRRDLPYFEAAQARLAALVRRIVKDSQ